MKTNELKELSVKDLTERIASEKDNLARLKVQHATSPVENPQVIKNARRDIARMMTVLSQKNLNN